MELALLENNVGNTMNEKYIQAAILGSLIGGKVLDDFIKPDSKQTNKKHMIIKSNAVDTI